MNLHPKVVQKILVMALTVAVVIIVWQTTGLHEAFSQFLFYLEQIARRSGPAGLMAFLLLAILASASGPFTVIPLVPAAVQVWGIWVTGVVMMLAGVVGGGLTYLIGRYAGGKVLHLFVRPSQVERWKAHISEDTAFFMALIAKFSMPAEIGYAFGMIRFGLMRYLVVTFISYIPLVAAILWSSDAFVKGHLAPILISIVTISTLTIGAGAYLHERRELAKKNRFKNFIRKLLRRKT